MSACNCFFKSHSSKTDNSQTSPQRLSQVAMLNRASTPPSVAPPRRQLEALERKINDLAKLEDDFHEIDGLAEGLRDVQMTLKTIKEDMAKKIGYPLAIQLINELNIFSEANDFPLHGQKLMLPPRSLTSNPWGWLVRQEEFKKALSHQISLELLPHGINSAEDVASKAAKIVNNNNGRNFKGCPEKLYLEIKLFKERGYLDVLRNSDADLHQFLSISSLIGGHFIAGPRVLHLMTQMLVKAKMQIGHFRQTADQKWEDRWQHAEAWFQIALECINAKANDHEDSQLPQSIPGLAKELDSIEELCRKTNAVSPAEAYSSERIAQCFKDVQQSGLLTTEIRNRYPLCCTFLECALDIRDKYKAYIADNKGKERLSTIMETRTTSGRSTKAFSTTNIKMNSHDVSQAARKHSAQV